MNASSLSPQYQTVSFGARLDVGRSRASQWSVHGVSFTAGIQATVRLTVSREEYWPDIEGLSKRDEVTEEAIPPETFFDLAMVYLLTTATLDELRRLYPGGRNEPRRFRPNLVIGTPPEPTGFAEAEWADKVLRIGDEVILKITGPCPRCVMTTLAQGQRRPSHRRPA